MEEILKRVDRYLDLYERQIKADEERAKAIRQAKEKSDEVMEDYRKNLKEGLQKFMLENFPKKGFN